MASSEEVFENVGYGLLFVIAGCLVLAIGGRVAYLAYTGQLDSTVKEVNGEVLVSRHDYGRILKIEYLSSTESSMPVFARLGDVAVPLGGGSSTSLFTKVETDSGFLLLSGSVSLRKGIQTHVSQFKNGSKVFEVVDGDSVLVFKMTP